MLINELLEKTARLYPDKEALVCGRKRLTYAQIDIFSNRLAHAFLAYRLEKQERVGIYLENCVESVISIYATLKASGIFVVINPQTKPNKLAYILNDCSIKILVTDTQHYTSAKEKFAECPNLKTIILIDSQDRKLNFYQILDRFPASQPPKNCIDVDLASLIYTSGSTGNPKGVMLTHLNMVSAINSITKYLENTPDDIIIDCLPLSFDYGLYQILMAFSFGGKVILERSFTYPYQIIDLILKEKVTGFPIVPAISAILLQLNNLNKYDFSCLRYITNTAQALPPKHIYRLKELFPHVKIFSMYGLTECKRVSYLEPELITRKPTSVGKAMPNMEVWLVDEKGNRITQPNTIGELVIRGSQIMKGYWNQPELTAQRLKPGLYGNEQILYSGDYFKMDEEGYLYFVSRKDDIIKTGGEMVSPKEVENVIYELDDVVETAVVGVADDILGNVIKAFVVLKEKSFLDEKDIILHCQKNLENFKVPKIIEFRKSLPKTPSGKISKKLLSEGVVVDSAEI
ncbi:MAG: AMP-binding protein [Candidatus Omnitrophica bacterium]|nr:AMP-binding protein [Candidatus Omnitrophota bacterium]